MFGSITFLYLYFIYRLYIVRVLLVCFVLFCSNSLTFFSLRLIVRLASFFVQF